MDRTLERSRMTTAQRREVDRMLEEGQPVHQGVMPDLDFETAFFAEMWSDLRASTHAEHPISLESIARIADEAQMPVLELWPLMQTMDRAYFEAQHKRLEAERKKSSAKAKARGGSRPSRGRRH